MKGLRTDQSGMVSIVVALVIMGIMTLVSVSFAFLTRREQRQALDRQLSTQAFYAAETGVNDAVSKIRNNTLGAVTDCSDAQQSQISSNRELDSSTGVGYTCVLVNRTPDSLIYDTIETDNSIVVRIRANQNIDNLKISWQDASDAGNFEDGWFSDARGNYYLPQDKAMKGNAVSNFLTSGSGQQTADFPNHIGMLRATIIPTNAITSTNSLLENSQTVFLYPEGHDLADQNGSVAFRNNQQLSREGVFGSGECNTQNQGGDFPRHCNTVITNINHDDFYLRLKAIYRPVAVTITATNDSGERLALDGAQAVVDATGKANDVLRRIQVRVPLRKDSYYYPEFALESANTICKRMRVGTTVIEIESPSNYLYGGSDLSESGGESNDRDKDTEACRVPDSAIPY